MLPLKQGVCHNTENGLENNHQVMSNYEGVECTDLATEGKAWATNYERRSEPRLRFMSARTAEEGGDVPIFFAAPQVQVVDFELLLISNNHLRANNMWHRIKKKIASSYTITRLLCIHFSALVIFSFWTQYPPTLRRYKRGTNGTWQILSFLGKKKNLCW